VPDNADAWLQIGVCHMQLKDFESALDPLKKCVELRPDYGVALFNLAVVYLNLKDNYSARDVYRTLMNIDPDLAEKLKKYLR
jgi:Tfp pilus assembly protein PilF